MNISEIYIPDRPFCIHCGYENDDVVKVRKHLLICNYDYVLLQCQNDKDLLRNRVAGSE